MKIHNVYQNLCDLDSYFWGTRTEIDSLETGLSLISWNDFEDAYSIINKFLPDKHFNEITKSNKTEVIKYIEKEILKRKTDIIKKFELCLKEK